MTSTLTGVLVELDAILDTRIGTVAHRFGDEVAFQVLQAGYHTRVDDKFPGVDYEEYRKAYQARDVEVLKHSTITDNVRLMREVIGELSQQAVGRPYHTGARVLVNVYPYTLTEDMRAALKELVLPWVTGYTELGVTHTVEIVSISKSDITPKFIVDNDVTTIFMYEYKDWFDAQAVNFKRTPLTGVTLYSPAIYHEVTPTTDEIEETIREFAHPFKAAMFTAKFWILLDLIDVNHFSIIEPPKT